MIESIINSTIFLKPQKGDVVKFKGELKKKVIQSVENLKEVYDYIRMLDYGDILMLSLK